jgi:hypothetical protein
MREKPLSFAGGCVRVRNGAYAKPRGVTGGSDGGPTTRLGANAPVRLKKRSATLTAATTGGFRLAGAGAPCSNKLSLGIQYQSAPPQTNFPSSVSTTQQHSPPLSRTPPLTLSLVATARSRYTPPTAPFPSALGLTPFATSVHAPVAIGGIGIGARARLTGDPGGGSRRCSIVREAYATATGTRAGPLRGVYSHGLRQLS